MYGSSGDDVRAISSVLLGNAVDLVARNRVCKQWRFTTSSASTNQCGLLVSNGWSAMRIYQVYTILLYFALEVRTLL